MSLTQIIQAAGVVGAGGAGFPSHIKLNTKADYYIINAAECEPLIETDKYLMRTFANEIISAVDKIGEHLGSKHKIIALKEKYKEEIKALSEAIKNANSNITLFKMQSFYPAGDEQMIVRLVTGKTVPERGLPLDVSSVVNNVGTVLNIYDALNGKNVTTKYLSVTGEVKEPIMLKVPIGTKITDCIKAANPTLTEYNIILGGPMMGRVILDSLENLTVTKLTGNILILPKEHYLFTRAKITLSRIKAQTKSACIQCKFCTELCPRFLTGHQIRPHLVMRNLYREEKITDNEEYKKTFGDAVNCCDCGICEMYACPMMLSPRKVNGFIKNRLRNRLITVERNPAPKSREGFDYKMVPTDKLVARLGLSKYYKHHAKTCIELNLNFVSIPLNQHIGAPAVPCVEVGVKVSKGDLIAKAVLDKPSANIHSSIDGVIKSVDANKIEIKC